MIRVIAAAMAWAVAHKAYGQAIQGRWPDTVRLNELLTQLTRAERGLLAALGALTTQKESFKNEHGTS